jgi:hypothetical protein
MVSSMNRRFDRSRGAIARMTLVVALSLLAPHAGAQSPDPASEPGATNEEADSVAEPEPEPTEGPEDPSVARAREAFRLGSTLARQGQWRDALAAFERAAELRPHPVTTYNLGYVERALGRLTRARKFLSESLAAGADGTGPSLPANLAALARGYMAEIDQNLVRVPVTIGRDHLAVAVDGRPLEAAAGEQGSRPLLIAGTAPPGNATVPPAASFDLLIDAGPHLILLSVAGERQTFINYTAEKGGTSTLQLTIDGAEAPQQAPAPVPAQPADSGVEPSGQSRFWTWTALGVGAAGVAAWSVFGILALSQNGELDDVCKPTRAECPENRQDDIERLHVWTTGADISLAVGIVGLAAGSVLWFTEPDGSADTAARRAPRATARAGVTPGGVVVEGTFW